VAKDLAAGVDVGFYGTTPYDRWDPALSIGAHWRF
jgi:hypothetical protein